MGGCTVCVCDTWVWGEDGAWTVPETPPDALPVFLHRAGFQPVAEICKYQTAE